jgi:hypothetical protein
VYNKLNTSLRIQKRITATTAESSLLPKIMVEHEPVNQLDVSG